MLILNKYLELDGIAQLTKFFLEEGKIRKYRKNDFFIQKGQKSKFVGFVIEGSFRYLNYTSEGKEQIVGYSFENDFVTDYGSFQNQTNSVVDIQTIKDSTIYIITYKELNNYYSNCKANDFRTKVAETYLTDVYDRLLSLYCDTPQERYIKLIHRYPDILRQVSLKEIASFIKITPETLSRIRKKISSTSNP
ncbi:Crp/Fnr family transcriptional regulator [Parabacteroides sp. Marseille-P3160]|uniref:Crp/Fnr family transcriptional regulator n=1 Tax=Parabacteroides sp. Marseille-P3160 TaxID=1917887 RepID=UPI0009BADD86|nr:Crp/Fnr family transcriptional regulator [Parabacteroides sp. Marseille-P3160]